MRRMTCARGTSAAFACATSWLYCHARKVTVIRYSVLAFVIHHITPDWCSLSSLFSRNPHDLLRARLHRTRVALTQVLRAAAGDHRSADWAHHLTRTGRQESPIHFGLPTVDYVNLELLPDARIMVPYPSVCVRGLCSGAVVSLSGLLDHAGRRRRRIWQGARRASGRKRSART